MSNGERIYLSLIGHRSELAAVETLANESVEIKPPRPLDAMVDAVDAPLGPEMIEPLLVHATVVLKFLAASVGFVGAVKTLLPKSEREIPRSLSSTPRPTPRLSPSRRTLIRRKPPRRSSPR